MKRYIKPLAPLAVIFIVGCGGSKSNDVAAPQPPATGFSYTDPTQGANDWALVKDASSTGQRLVLNLLGPSTSKYRGVGFTLQADPALVKFGKFTDNSGHTQGYYLDKGIFMDKDDSAADIPPILQAGGVRDDKLMVGIYQKRDDEVWGPFLGATAKDCHATVLQVAIDFDASLKALPGDVPLTVLKARVIPNNVDTIETRKTVAVPLKVGKLTLK
jgi:hypothetical protein